MLCMLVRGGDGETACMTRDVCTQSNAADVNTQTADLHTNRAKQKKEICQWKIYWIRTKCFF